jgi:hypothetical protein
MRDSHRPEKGGNAFDIEAKEKKELQGAISMYKPSVKDEAARKKAYNRYYNMRSGRTGGDLNFEDEWDDGDKAYEAFVEPLDEDDWRSNLHIPIEFSLTQTMLREMIQVPSMFYTKPQNEASYSQSTLMNQVIKYALQKGKYQVVKNLLDHSRIVRGTAVGKVTYRLERRKIQELKKFDNEHPDQEEYTKKEIDDFNDAYVKFIDNWFFFVDEMARNIDDARDCVEREVLNIKEFHRLYDKYENAKYVVPGGDITMHQYYQPPQDVTARDVEILHYWSKSPDKYIIVANDVTIRNNPNPYSHKQLPFFMLYGYRDPNNIYGKGLPKVIKHLVAEMNTLRNMRIDFQHMSANKMFLISDQLDVEEEDLVTRPHGMIPVSTTNMPLQNYIMPIEYGDVKLSNDRDIGYIAEDIRRTVGVDDQIAGQKSGATATEASIMKEVTMKAIQQMVVNAEIDGLIRAGELFVATIQQYYPLVKVKDITKNSSSYHQIPMKGLALKENQAGQPQLEVAKGYNFFEAKPEYIRGQFDVAIESSPMPYVSKAMQQAKITEMIQTLAQANLSDQLDPKKAVEQYLRIHDEQPDDWMKETLETQDEQKLAMEENAQMIQGIPLPPTPNVTPDHTMIHIQQAMQLEQAAQAAQGQPGGQPQGQPQPGDPNAGQPPQGDPNAQPGQPAPGGAPAGAPPAPGTPPPTQPGGTPPTAPVQTTPTGDPNTPVSGATPPLAQAPAGTVSPQVLAIFKQHIMGEQAEHQGGKRTPTKAGGKGASKGGKHGGSPSKKPVGGMTSPKQVNPLKMTGGEGTNALQPKNG